MSFFDGVRNLYSSPNRFQKYLDDFYSGADVGTGVISTDVALKYSAVFACCRVLAETFASVPLHEYQRRKDDGRDRTHNTAALDIMAYKPNEEMDSYNLAEMIMYQLNLGGNFYAKVQRNSMGEVINLNPFVHQSITLERNCDTKKIAYTYTKDCETETLYRPEMFHIVGLSTNGLVGMSPITYSAEAIRLGLNYQNLGTQTFKNGIFPTGMFSKDRPFSDKGYANFKKIIEEEYKSHRGAPIIADDGMTYTPFALNFADAQILESRKFQIVDVTRAFRVPPHMINDLERSTNNNIEHQSLEFLMYTMLPSFKRVERAINTQLLSLSARKEGYYLEYNMAALLRGDQASMAKAFATGRQWGWLSVNDIRRMMNMNPIQNGDRYLEPSNMIEAGAVTDETSREVENILKERHT